MGGECEVAVDPTELGAPDEAQWRMVPRGWGVMGGPPPVIWGDVHFKREKSWPEDSTSLHLLRHSPNHGAQPIFPCLHRTLSFQ